MNSILQKGRKESAVEQQLSKEGPTNLKSFIREETANAVSTPDTMPGTYEVFAVRKSPGWKDRYIRVGSYTEKELGRAAGLATQFRATIKILAEKAATLESVPESSVEHAYQLPLLWSQIGQLKKYLGASPAISEIVAEFLTARHQCRGRDTSITALKSVKLALTTVFEAPRITDAVADRVSDLLIEGGFDMFSPDALRKEDE
jgi:hypothetical protein